MSEKMTFNEFCEKFCDGLYNPRFPDKEQCTGYLKLKEMVVQQIEPASFEETNRWETNPAPEELSEEPKLMYLRFLHVNLRPLIINNWHFIKNLKV
jgi:hypothetical protein